MSCFSLFTIGQTKEYVCLRLPDRPYLNSPTLAVFMQFLKSCKSKTILSLFLGKKSPLLWYNIYVLTKNTRKTIILVLVYPFKTVL